MRARHWLLVLWALGALFIAAPAAPLAQPVPSVSGPKAKTELARALAPAEWKRLDAAVDRALDWLATQQQPDGSFPTRDTGQPAVTALGVLAFLSRGHLPGEGKHGEVINRAIDYALAAQQPDGLFSFVAPERQHVHQGASHTGSYNHAITGLMLTEVFGQISRERAEKIRSAVNLAIKRVERLQVEPVKRYPIDAGGWRYLYSAAHVPSDSDLSVTGWRLKFLRSAKNAQFDIPDKMVESAVAYMEKCYDPDQKAFLYGLNGRDRYVSRGMVGVGALTLALAGKHNTEMARAAGDWILQRPFATYGETTAELDRFHYSAYYCSNAMAQLGGRYWEEFFPKLVKTLLDAQQPEGNWASEVGAEDAIYGSAYPTALSVLSLTPAYQLLPIYQR